MVSRFSLVHHSSPLPEPEPPLVRAHHFASLFVMLATHSLLTIDQTRRGQLLPDVDVDAAASRPAPVLLTSDEQVDARESAVLVVDELLSPAECDVMWRTASDTFGLTSLTHSYVTTERQSDRLCILDCELTQLIWQRLGPFRTQLECPLFGSNALRLNECWRLSRYTAPSVGFKPHFDSPYVPSASERSALSVVVYLADVGSTDFYFIPADSATADVVGLTTDEEIAVRGGLERYHKYTVQAKRGRCVIFPHDLLHAGAPVDAGTKWVLRTDVVFSVDDSDVSPAMSAGDHHSVALEWFREAQNQELDGNVLQASRLYERTLSMRQHLHRNAADAAADSTSSSGNAHTWPLVLYFLDLNDLTHVAACSKAFQAWCERHRAIQDALWRKRHPEHDGLCDTIRNVQSAERAHWYYASATPRTQHQIEAHMPHYLPRFQSRHGSLCKFAYTRSVFDSNPAACLRALAMAAVYQFGVSAKSHTYVAQYDAERDRALACSMRELLDAAYYERPLAGAWYHVHRSSAADLTQAQCPPGSADNCVNPTPREALQKSVDPRMLQSRTAANSGAQAVVGFEAHLARGGDQYMAVFERNRKYLTGYTALRQTTTSLYKYKRCDHNRGGAPDGCPHEDWYGDVDHLVYYNNLICDFSQARLEVEEVDDDQWRCRCTQKLIQPYACRYWKAHLEPLNIAPFQHAACQWRSGAKQPNTQNYKRSFGGDHVWQGHRYARSCQRALHHLHVFQMDDAAEVDEEQWERESDSEVHDGNDRDHSDDELEQRDVLDVDNMLAPPVADADYMFVTQYAALDVM